MKKVLMSFQPKWVEKIVSREKDIEVRTKIPKCELPMDVYIYCTMDNKYSYAVCEYQRGKVVAKFTVEKIEEFIVNKEGIETDGLCDLCFIDLPKETQLTLEELQKYIKVGNKGYAWHIDNLVIFDKPKELNEFKMWKNYGLYNHLEPLTKAPTNYCYVEVEE